MLHETNKKELLKLNKRYCIQIKDYLLYTPETYWYPRPGTAYSDVSPDWQQSYFSHFNVNVKTQPGLASITQNEDKPFQAISLIIGRYKQIQTQKDSIQYNLWYIDGNDYFTSCLDSIQDTIPSLINNVKEHIERTYHLEYPFKQFSLVEVPAQFYSYPHAWSNAQEVMQPGMVLYPEKGCLFHFCNFQQEKKNHKWWEKHNGKELSEKDAQIRAFNGFVWSFTNPNGDFKFKKGRGNFKMDNTNNPYFLFPQIYNFRYNIYSPEWPITNRLVELYLQGKRDVDDWQRNMNGISPFEKALVPILTSAGTNRS